MDALEPFRVAGPRRTRSRCRTCGSGGKTGPSTSSLKWPCRPEGTPSRTSSAASNFKHLYWNMASSLPIIRSTAATCGPGDLLALRHDQRPGAGQLRQPAGTDLERREAAGSAGGGERSVSGGRRRRDHDRLVPGRRLSRRLRRGDRACFAVMPGSGVSGPSDNSACPLSNSLATTALIAGVDQLRRTAIISGPEMSMSIG